MSNAKFASTLPDSKFLSAIASVIHDLSVDKGSFSKPLSKNLQKMEGLLRSRHTKQAIEHADSMASQLYDTAAEHFAGNQIAALIRKYPFNPSPFDPEGAALELFLKNERRMWRVNRKLAIWASIRRIVKNPEDPSSKCRPHLVAMTRMQNYCRKVLGPFDIDKVQEGCDFGSGASTGVTGNATNLLRLIGGENWSGTRHALSHLCRALWNNSTARDMILPGHIKCYDPLVFGDILRDSVDFDTTNKLTIVPKKAKIGRPVLPQKALDLFLQKGCDKYMRKRLKQFGVDLSDRTINQRRAREGSITGQPFGKALATLDLSSASDSISTMLVKLLLPAEWFEYLDSIRTPVYKIGEDGEDRESPTFASMGNAFCFPLESLIFAAFCHASGSKDFTVYGDDIILEQEAALYCVELLTYFGFKINVEKSFFHGPFRESCGADWYDGEDVRPFEADTSLNGTRALYAAYNGTLRNWRSTQLLCRLRQIIWETVPKGERFVGLDDRWLDSYFIVPLDESFMCSPFTRWNRELFQWEWKGLIATPVTDPISKHWDLPFVDMYSLLRGSMSQAMYTLRYQVSEKVRWLPHGKGLPTHETRRTSPNATKATPQRAEWSKTEAFQKIGKVSAGFHQLRQSFKTNYR